MRAASALVLSFAIAGIARASDDDVLAQAKAHFQKGREAYDAADYPTAIREFQSAEALKASPLLSYNIGLAYEQSGDHLHAVDAYRRYLEAKPDAKNRAEVEQRIAALAPPAPPAPEPAPGAVPTEPARPVACPPGELVTDETAGNCCWPGQVWSRRRRACAGVPQCPPGMVASGELCRYASSMPLDVDPWAGLPSAPGVMPMAPSAPPGTIAVGFTAKHAAYVYRVAIGRGAGQHVCMTPCTLYLKPGPSHAEVVGDVSYEQRLRIPDAPVTFEVQHRRWPSFIGGTILMGLGTAAAIVATVFLPNVGGNEGDALHGGVSFATFTAAGVLLPIGISMMASLGENKVSALHGPAAYSRARTPRYAGLGAAASPTGGAATIRFDY